MELNEQTNSWIDEQSYKDEFERVEQFKKRNEFINMKILWLSGNPALYKRKSMIDGGWIGTLQKEIVKENIDLAIAFPYLKDDSSSEEDGVKYYPMYLPKWKKRIWYFNQKKVNGFFLHKIKPAYLIFIFYLSTLNFYLFTFILCFWSFYLKLMGYIIKALLFSHNLL